MVKDDTAKVKLEELRAVKQWRDYKEPGMEVDQTRERYPLASLTKMIANKSSKTEVWEHLRSIRDSVNESLRSEIDLILDEEIKEPE